MDVITNVKDNGFDILTAAKTVKIQSAMVAPNNIPLQGIPSGCSQYGRYLCIGGNYPILIYVDVNGGMGYYSVNLKKWYKITSTSTN